MLIVKGYHISEKTYTFGRGLLLLLLLGLAKNEEEVVHIL